MTEVENEASPVDITKKPKSLTPDKLTHEERIKVVGDLPETKGPIRKIEEALGEAAKSKGDVFKSQDNITALELGNKINDRMSEISEKKGDVTNEDYENARKEIIDSLKEEELQEILENRVTDLNKKIKDIEGSELETSIYDKLKEKSPQLKNIEESTNSELTKELLATYGKDKLEAFSPLLEQLKNDGKEIPDSLEEFDELLLKKIVERRIEEEYSVNSNNVDINFSKVKEQAIAEGKNIINNGTSEEVSNNLGTTGVNDSLFSPKNYDKSELNSSYSKGAELTENTKKELKDIYNTNSNNDKRILDTIDHLSDNNGFKNNVATFLIEAYKTYKQKIYQANGDLGGIRSLEQQQGIMNKGEGATKVSKASNSYHTKGEAIDLNIPANSPLVKLAAKYGLWNGQEMWGWDSGHFQSEYSGDNSKKQSRLAKMESRGTLPKNS